MEWTNGHAESLNKAVECSKIPPKLRINIKTMVVNSNEPIFQREWTEVVKSSQTTLIKTITTHLGRTARVANQKIRANKVEAKYQKYRREDHPPPQLNPQGG